MFSPCVVDQSELRFLEREDLESRVREAERENRRLRLQLNQSQRSELLLAEGNYSSHHWVAVVDTGPVDGENTTDKQGNRSNCAQEALVERCEVRC